MSALALIVAGTGVALLVVAALGLHLLPDALSRQHAATKAVTLALGLILVGAGLQAGAPGWWVRIAVILVLLLMTLPVASHLLARAAARQAYTAEQLAEAPRVDGD